MYPIRDARRACGCACRFISANNLPETVPYPKVSTPLTLRSPPHERNQLILWTFSRQANVPVVD